MFKKIAAFLNGEDTALISAMDLAQKQYLSEAVFLCYKCEQPDDTNAYQLWGTPWNAAIRSGMSLVFNGIAYSIAEVYGDLDDQENGNTEAAAGLPRTPIVIVDTNFKGADLQTEITEHKIVALGIVSGPTEPFQTSTLQENS
jgi:hypothetical protein